jgi:TatD DNase family protein
LVPSDRLHVETDSPFLTPVPHRGRPNEPRFVTLVGAFLADLRGVTPEEMAQSTSANTARLFAIA